MKPETLMDAIGRLDDSLLTEAVQPRRRTWVRWIAVAAAICLTISAVWLVPHYMNNSMGTTLPGDTSAAESDIISGNDEAVDSQGDVLDNEETDAPQCLMPMGNVLAKAVYPKMPARPAGYSNDEAARQAWRTDLNERYHLLADKPADMTVFYTNTMKTFLSDTRGENCVFAPLNVYLALSMLAETTDGNSRSQLLNVLGVKDLGTLRKQGDCLWNGTYRDDGAVTCRLANSMWLADGEIYKQAPLDILAERYYASSFAGEMGSAEYTALLQEWLNEQTGGLLKQQAGNVELTPDTALALASTIYFSARWDAEFLTDRNKKDIFSTPTGKVTVEYMCRKPVDSLYDGENYTAYRMSMDANRYNMWLFLPHKGTTPEELAGDPALLHIMKNYGHIEGWYGEVDLQVPKFDAMSECDLVEGLKTLGMTDVFAESADFSPLSNREDLFVDKIQHAARVKIDEEGCTAAAYTVERLCGSAKPEDEETRPFIVNRPFLFAVTASDDATVLFTGIVNEP